MVGDSSFSYHPRMSGTSQSGKRPPRELTAASRGGARGVRAAWSVHRAFADLGDQPSLFPFLLQGEPIEQQTDFNFLPVVSI